MTDEGPAQQWAIELLAIDSKSLREIAAMIDALPGPLELARSLGLPFDVLAGGGSYGLRNR